MKIVGEKIRIERVIKGYSQEYMSFMLDISQAAFSKIERGESELTLKRVYQIAEVLEISPFQLMPKPKYGAVFHLHDFVERLRTLFHALCKLRSSGH